MINGNIYLADCSKMNDIIPRETIDLIVTSPPYDDLRSYDNVGSWNWPAFEVIAAALYAVLKPGGVLVWIVNDMVINGSESGSSFSQALYFKNIGFRLYDTMIWDKGQCANPSFVRYGANFEYMFVFTKGKPKTVNLIRDHKNKYFGVEDGTGTHTRRRKDGSMIISKRPCVAEFGIRSNIWAVSPASSNKTGHPAVFPLALAKDHILTWSLPGELVLDPFAGSGTTLLAAKETGRNWIGIEQNPRYVDIIKRRLELK